ncbi:MAG: hypothetical protein CM1200mP1_11190 [Candidatus Neomarinimicrobiota bacterium]|nr:MAG: hypothetical protein CM1200mP1_11190 [Candidatus Neomarinimicrobiota bacterium]
MTQSFLEKMPRTGQQVNMNNVIARFNVQATKQIMISATGIQDLGEIEAKA